MSAETSRQAGILLFDDVEELDFAGPWEVFSSLREHVDSSFEVVTIAENSPVRCAKRLQVVPDCDLAGAPRLDVLLVPGGMGTRREVDNAVLIEWIRKVSESCEWVTSVCTGALLLHEAGPARGKRVTTHHAFIESLRKRGDVEVLENVRYVRDGNLLTSAGVSAGIDMALWLVGQLYSPQTARELQRFIEYDPAPPYAAET